MRSGRIRTTKTSSRSRKVRRRSVGICVGRTRAWTGGVNGLDEAASCDNAFIIAMRRHTRMQCLTTY